MNIYTIELHFPEKRFTMPYYFTSMQEAILYGEYEFREFQDMINYRIEKYLKIEPFYKLK